MTTSEPTVKSQRPGNGNLIPWKPGQSGNPLGRPIGARNKLSEDFLNALHEEFQEHGKAAVEKVRLERPMEFLKIIASLVPREMNLNVALRDQLAAFLGSMHDITPNSDPDSDPDLA